MFNLALLELKRVGLITLGLVAGLALAALVWWSAPAWAEDVRVSIATGLDVTTSDTPDETAIQLQGFGIATMPASSLLELAKRKR